MLPPSVTAFWPFDLHLIAALVSASVSVGVFVPLFIPFQFLFHFFFVYFALKPKRLNYLKVARARLPFFVAGFLVLFWNLWDFNISLGFAFLFVFSFCFCLFPFWLLLFGLPTQFVNRFLSVNWLSFFCFSSLVLSRLFPRCFFAFFSQPATCCCPFGWNRFICLAVNPPGIAIRIVPPATPPLHRLHSVNYDIAGSCCCSCNRL